MRDERVSLRNIRVLPQFSVVTPYVKSSCSSEVELKEERYLRNVLVKVHDFCA